VGKVKAGLVAAGSVFVVAQWLLVEHAAMWLVAGAGFHR
jgi:hypothetical protein